MTDVTTWNKATVPGGTNPWSLVPDLKSSIETAGLTIEVANAAERAGLAALAPGGVLPVATLVFQTDEKKWYGWDGTAWRPTAPGMTAYQYTAATAAGFSSGSWLVNEINNVSLKAGRKYRVAFRFNHVFTSAASLAFSIDLRKSLTTDTGTTGTLLEGGGWVFWSAPVSNSGMTSRCEAYYTPTVDETVRFLVTTGRLTGSSLYDLAARTFTITDEGYLP